MTSLRVNQGCRPQLVDKELCQKNKNIRTCYAEEDEKEKGEFIGSSDSSDQQFPCDSVPLWLVIFSGLLIEQHARVQSLGPFDCGEQPEILGVVVSSRVETCRF